MYIVQNQFFDPVTHSLSTIRLILAIDALNPRARAQLHELHGLCLKRRCCRFVAKQSTRMVHVHIRFVKTVTNTLSSIYTGMYVNSSDYSSHISNVHV